MQTLHRFFIAIDADILKLQGFKPMWVLHKCALSLGDLHVIYLCIHVAVALLEKEYLPSSPEHYDTHEQHLLTNA